MSRSSPWAVAGSSGATRAACWSHPGVGRPDLPQSKCTLPHSGLLPQPDCEGACTELLPAHGERFESAALSNVSFLRRILPRMSVCPFAEAGAGVRAAPLLPSIRGASGPRCAKFRLLCLAAHHWRECG